VKLSIYDLIRRGVEGMARFAGNRGRCVGISYRSAETVSGFRAGEITAPINRGGYYGD